ncbi:secretory phospholipase A2 receptor-like [Antennarius striatus]|uniref:secretory phospholipase A2 receptor-like n=1 Tax=Antennarius striatus TaxID=241820 RepID=UPI0035B184CA
MMYLFSDQILLYRFRAVTMERNIHLLLILVVLPSIPCSATSSLRVLKVVQIFHVRTWDNAQAFCRKKYSDLVTISNVGEAKSLASFEGWIGLRFYGFHQWYWSKGNNISNFFFWDSGVSGVQPILNKYCAFKNKSNAYWARDHCRARHRFMCFDETMILVKELKTWEEAVQHCRELQDEGPDGIAASNSYHLASLPEVNNIVLDRETIQLADSHEVWIGLRFLAGEWVWISGESVTSSYLPPCPSQQQYCGAMGPEDKRWKMRDCNERRNFLCSITR